MCFTMSNHNDVAMFQFKRQMLDQSMLKVCREMPNGRSRWFNIKVKNGIVFVGIEEPWTVGLYIHIDTINTMVKKRLHNIQLQIKKKNTFNYTS